MDKIGVPPPMMNDSSLAALVTAGGKVVQSTPRRLWIVDWNENLTIWIALNRYAVVNGNLKWYVKTDKSFILT